MFRLTAPPPSRSNKSISMLTFEQARHEVVIQISKLNRAAQTIDLSVWDAAGYVLAKNLIPAPTYPDAVMMIEYTTRDKDLVHFQQSATKGQNIVPAGSEGAKNQLLLQSGTRLGYAELSLAAQIGATQLRCAKKPRVAILSTGDEIIPVDASPGPFQIRNSNSVSLAAQIREAGGDPVILGNASDRI